jgi:dihydrolipoamide dehydrogenase
MKHYDLIVIGAGPGGTPAAMAAAQFGKKVLLVDKHGEPGGECLFEGCIPSKILENAANRYSMLADISKFHIDLSGVSQIHWEEVIEEKANLLRQRSMAALRQMEALPNLGFIQGKARFTDSHTIAVNDTQYTFTHAVIATGASASVPPFKGSGVAHAWTNAHIFKEKEIPKEIAFIGAGAISCELVQMFNKLGTTCHLFERGPRILKRIDEACAMKVQEKMVADGIDVILNADMDSIDGKNGDFTITYRQNGTAHTLKVPHVLIATGRAANVENLGLDAAGVTYSAKGIETDKTLQTSQPHIYAAGDCVVGPKFAHWATYQAGIAIHNLYAPHKHHIDMGKLSWVLFSDPQIASVGITEADAQKYGMDVTVETYNYAVDARAQIDKETTGMLKFVIEKQSGIIKGIQILSADASSLSGEAALIVAKGMTTMDLMGTIHPHPTLTEAFGKLAQQCFFKSMFSKGASHGKHA